MGQGIRKKKKMFPTLKRGCQEDFDFPNTEIHFKLGCYGCTCPSHLFSATSSGVQSCHFIHIKGIENAKYGN